MSRQHEALKETLVFHIMNVECVSISHGLSVGGLCRDCIVLPVVTGPFQ